MFEISISSTLVKWAVTVLVVVYTASTAIAWLQGLVLSTSYLIK